MKRLSFMILAVLIVSGCAVSSTDKVVKAGQSKSGFMGLSKTADVVVNNPRILQNQSGKVIIGSFKVAFMHDAKARSATRSGMFSPGIGRGKATATAHLKGLETAQMQKLTNDIYQQFVSELKAQGYTVLSPEELASVPEYADLQNLGEPSPKENVAISMVAEGKSTYVAPDGMKLVYYSGERQGLQNINQETIKKAQGLAMKTDAAVLGVHYIVAFINANSHSSFTSASVQIGQGVTILPTNAVTYFKDNKSFMAYVTLGQAITSEKEFATIDNVTSAASKTLGTAVNVASALLGGATTQAENYNVTIKPDSYSDAVLDASGQATKKIVAKIAENKPAAKVEEVAAPAAVPETPAATESK